MSQVFRKWWLWTLIGIVIAIPILLAVFSSGSSGQEVDLSQFIRDVENRRVTRIEVDGRSVEYQVANAQGTYETKIERGDSVRDILAERGLEPGSSDYPAITIDGGSSLLSIVLQFLPIIFIVGVLFFFLRQAYQAQRRWPFSMLVTNFDPVCRTAVNPGSSAGSSTFMNNTYYFCSGEHKAQFDADPVKYLLQK